MFVPKEGGEEGPKLVLFPRDELRVGRAAVIDGGCFPRNSDVRGEKTITSVYS